MSLFCAKDADSFRSDRLMLAAASHPMLADLSDTAILGKLHAAEKQVGRQLKVYLEPTAVFPYAPSEAEIDALDGMPWDEEPGYDYDPDFFRSDSWGFLVLNSRPVVEVTRIRLAYPAPYESFYEIPKDWIRIDKKRGQVRLVPATSSFTAPLSAFLMQAMGGGRAIPYMIQVNYVAGLRDAKTDWPDLVEVILKTAVLSMIKDAFRPQSGSISADGLSQSLSIDTARYADDIHELLFGPKGSNGGLWTAIHGLPGSALGAGN